MAPSTCNSPRVTVVIPTKNRLSLLLETIASVQQQTYPHWEAIVVDDGSTDGTIEQMTRIAQNDPRVRFIRRTNVTAGAPACRNEGFDHSTGDYIIFLDSDDLLAPFCFAERVKAMESNPKLDFGVFYSEMFRFTAGDTGIFFNVATTENDLDRFLALDLPWQTACPIWRRSALDKLGPWDESLLSWQDWDFHVRALALPLGFHHFFLRDCFFRLPGPNRDTIGGNLTKPQHLVRVEQLLYKTYTIFRTKHLLTPQRRKLFTGLCICLVWHWNLNALGSQACLALLRFWKKGMCGIREADAWLYSACVKRRGFWRLRAGLEKRICAKYRTLNGTTTWNRIPLIHPLAQHIMLEPLPQKQTNKE